MNEASKLLGSNLQALRMQCSAKRGAYVPSLFTTIGDEVFFGTRDGHSILATERY
jgi:hypothetical protein